MRKLLVLVVVAFAAWFGWKHWSELREAPRDEAIVSNESGRDMQRVRLGVGDQTFVRESIADGEKASFPFHVTGDGTFTLRWQFQREDVDKSWSGGTVTAGPIRTRHVIQVLSDGGVVWTSERAPAAKP
jgi:hypothetical protein